MSTMRQRSAFGSTTFARGWNIRAKGEVHLSLGIPDNGGQYLLEKTMHSGFCPVPPEEENRP